MLIIICYNYFALKLPIFFLPSPSTVKLGRICTATTWFPSCCHVKSLAAAELIILQSFLFEISDMGRDGTVRAQSSMLKCIMQHLAETVVFRSLCVPP